MKLQALPTAAKTTPVAVSVIAAATQPIVNTQPSSVAPGTSGKNMQQFEALVGQTNTAYPTLYLAHRACVSAAATVGCANYSNVPSDANVVRILAW